MVMALTSWTVTENNSSDQITTLKSSSSCRVHCTVIDSETGDMLTEAYWKIQGSTQSQYVDDTDASFEVTVSSGSSLEIGCDGYQTTVTDPITSDNLNMQVGLNSSSSNNNVVVIMTKK